MLKKLLALALAVALVFSLAACGGDGKDKDKSSKDTAGNNNDDYVSSGGITTDDVEDAVLQTDLAKKDYGGKKFTFYYWYAINEIINRKVSAFNKAHNANVEVKVLSGEPTENLATSIAEGAPIDLFANHTLFFPQTVFADLFEPLEGYINELDYFNAEKPENGGLSKTLNDDFTWKNQIYAACSAKAVYGYAFYYNKLKYAEAGLEDPYDLWKDGKWTWDKAKEMGEEVTDIANNVGFLQIMDLTIWITANGVRPIQRQGDTYSEQLASAEVMSAINSWQQLLFGDVPLAVTSSSAFKSGKAYSLITYTDGYTQLAKEVKTSSAFGRNVDNMGIVPMPEGLCANGKYPGHVAQGYSAARGAADPSVAACYALFESRTTDKEVGSSLQLPAEIRNWIDNAIAARGFVGFAGLADSEGTTTETVIKQSIGWPILEGADVTSSVEAQRSVINRIISDAMSRAK